MSTPSNASAEGIALRDRVIVALDVPSIEEANALVDALGDAVGFYKIGMELQFAPGGIDYVRHLTELGKKVFFDAKLLDIDETVARAVTNIAALGAHFLTIHAHQTRTIQAALRGRGDGALKILGVSVLTSLDESDLAESGIKMPVRELVLARAKMAASAGADGVIASGAEAAAIRAVVPKTFRIVTPGIRRASDAPGDQKRIVTPKDAILAGADHLVVGRPITRAASPRSEAEAILGEVEAALDMRAC
jgi:orotidine-5'-phosphate decarboxylase